MARKKKVVDEVDLEKAELYSFDAPCIVKLDVQSFDPRLMSRYEWKDLGRLFSAGLELIVVQVEREK